MLGPLDLRRSRIGIKCSPRMLWPGLEPNGAVLMLDGSIVDGAIGGIGLDFGSREIVKASRAMRETYESLVSG